MAALLLERVPVSCQPLESLRHVAIPQPLGGLDDLATRGQFLLIFALHRQLNALIGQKQLHVTFASSSSLIFLSEFPCSFRTSLSSAYKEGWFLPTSAFNRRCQPSVRLFVRGSPSLAAKCWFHSSGWYVGLPYRTAPLPRRFFALRRCPRRTPPGRPARPADPPLPVRAVGKTQSRLAGGPRTARGGRHFAQGGRGKGAGLP